MNFLLIILLAVAACGIYIFLSSIVNVPAGKVGIVHRRFGRQHPDDIFNVRVYNSPGPQATVLRADRMYVRPRFLYKVSYEPQTYVPPGTIGVMVANVGSVTPPSQMLGKSVSCNSFQDGRDFLLGGGQMGRQPDVLVGGTYSINPLIFDVLTVDTIGPGRLGLTPADLREISVPEGTTGVVIALAGVQSDDAQSDGTVGPRVPGHQSFQLASVFLENHGQRGAQAETLSHGGVYHINPWFARVVLIPTRDLILEWSRKDSKPGNNFDAALDQIVVNIEGHRLRFTMSQTIRIPAQSAPRLVGRFGEEETGIFGASHASNPAPVQRFVEKVLGRTVEGYFQSTASTYQVLSFVAAHDEVRLELEDRVRQALAEWGVEAVRTTLNEFESENDDLDNLRWKIASERVRTAALEFEVTNARIEEDRELIRIRVERERRKNEQTELEEQVRILGRDHVALERFLAQLAQMNVPEFVGSDAGALLNYMPLQVAQDLINKSLNRFQMPENPVPQQLGPGSQPDSFQPLPAPVRDQDPGDR
jgi:hypothetical protein